ncbi:PREDICTED: eclosion hormone-like [Diuraphis noxia]|uniref:eclosion hormone-like n=1 Tax=Diuraphis noxia TaxID=143948 RepID=UPI000763763D|nr:PREDICTED: eclosion hormone-like [Diuraphis noxia]
MMNTPSTKKLAMMATAFVLIAAIVSYVSADMSDVGLCIRNCAQCKKMLGAYFEGSLCADACVKFKGKMIPDCENIESVAPFLNKLE